MPAEGLFEVNIGHRGVQRLEMGQDLATPSQASSRTTEGAVVGFRDLLD